MEAGWLARALLFASVILVAASQDDGIRIIQKPEDCLVVSGTTARFECEALSDSPLPLTVEWQHNGNNVDFTAPETRYEQETDTLFTIRHVTYEDAGTVTCIVRRGEVVVSANASITVQDVPGPPRVVNVTCHNREAVLRWEPAAADDNGGNVKGYNVQHNNSFTPDLWEGAHHVAAPVTEHTIGLSPWMNYTFRVVAWSDVGHSAASEPSSVCTTPPGVPLKNPGRPEGRGTEPHNIIIRWDVMPESEHNGPGFVYRVYWRPDVAGEQWSSADIGDWRQNQMMIPDQPVFQRYRIKVAAFNRLGEAAPPAEFIGYSGEGVPTQAPTNLKILDITNRQVALSWDPVQPETLQGHFKGYKIQTWTDEGGEKDIHETVVWSPTKTRAHVNIAANSRTHARVLAYNGRNNGPPSDTLSFDTPEGVPGPVRTLDAHQLGSTALYLTWEPPYETNGALTGYKIYYQTVDGTMVGETIERAPQISDPQSKRAKLSGLKADTKYRIAITATTKTGEGDQYFIEHRTRAGTEVARPDTPSLEWHQESVTSVRVVWLPHVQGRGGSHFYVKLRQKGETAYAQTRPELREDFTIVRGLVPCVVYEMALVAVDGEYEAASAVQETVLATDEACKENNELDGDSTNLD